jgi:glycosyltransferase involved in cell wall biosynthesis
VTPSAADLTVASTRGINFDVVMLASVTLGADVRSAVSSLERPLPEYLVLEREYGVDLLDWATLGLQPGTRTLTRSLRHVLAALPRTRHADVILSDGEHLGLPLALALRVKSSGIPHVMIGHNLLNPHKRRLLARVRLRPMDRVIVHSERQVDAIVRTTTLRPEQLAVIPYGVDTQFWSTLEGPCQAENDHIVSAGREHRDYATLVDALPVRARLTVADHSLFTPSATRRDPASWPDSVARVAADYLHLRRLYEQAAIVVVPLIESDMPAGITTLLEAMSMGRPVIVSGTQELQGVVQNRESGLVVPPGDVSAMRAAIVELLDNPNLRAYLGIRARQAAVKRFDVRRYAAALAGQLADAAGLASASSNRQ